MLSIKNLSKSFSKKKYFFSKSAKHKKIIKNLSFETSNSSITFVQGSNGTGKTTFLKLLSGIILADRGAISLDNKKIKRDQIDYIDSSERSFFWRLSVKENLIFFARVNFLPAETIQKIDIFLKEFNCYELRNIEFMKLSSGEKQRINLVRAFLKNARIMLFDEVTNSIDEESKNILYTKVKDAANNGKIIFWSSHDLEERELLKCTHALDLENI